MKNKNTNSSNPLISVSLLRYIIEMSYILVWLSQSYYFKKGIHLLLKDTPYNILKTFKNFVAFIKTDNVLDKSIIWIIPLLGVTYLMDIGITWSIKPIKIIPTLIWIVLLGAVCIIFRVYEENYIIEEIYIYSILLSSIKLFSYIHSLFKKSSKRNLLKDLSKKERFKLFDKNLANKSDKGRYSLNWRTHNNKHLTIKNSKRGILLIGVAGSGKSYTIIDEIIEQTIHQGQSAFIYDVKFEDLTLVAYNQYLREKKNNPSDPRKFSVIYPNDIRYSHQSNPFDPSIINNEALCREAVQTILYNLNKNWATKSGDFFSDSAITFAAGAAWYLNIKHKETQKYISTTPHLIEFISYPNSAMTIALIMESKECQSIVAGIATGYYAGATDQIAGQIASLQISTSKLADKNIYYISCENNIYLDVNNFDHPTILNVGGAIKTQKAYAPILSLYASTVKQVCNEDNRNLMLYALDEAATLFVENLQELPNTGRGRGITTLVGLQSRSQLYLGYGDKSGKVLEKAFGNIIIGQITEKDLADEISSLLGEFKVREKSKSIASDGTVSESISDRMKPVINFQILKGLEQGEFVGATSDAIEDTLENTEGLSSSFATRIIIEKQKKIVKKLPYFNEELKKKFKKDIKNNEKSFFEEYLQIIAQIEEEDFKKLNEFSELYQVDYAFLKDMYFEKYTFKNKIIKDYLKESKVKKTKETIKETVKINNEIELKSKKLEEETKDILKGILLESKKENVKIIPYLYHFISRNYQEKEEQKIMKEVLTKNFFRIKNETTNFIIEEYIILQIQKHLKNICSNPTKFKELYEIIESLEEEELTIAQIERGIIKEDEIAYIKQEIINLEFNDIIKINTEEQKEAVNNQLKEYKIIASNDNYLSKLNNYFQQDNFSIKNYYHAIPSPTKTILINKYKNKYETLQNTQVGKMNYENITKELDISIMQVKIFVYMLLDPYFIKSFKRIIK